MPQGRPAIPAALQDALLVEAGHRCAIPACRAAMPLEFEHIEEWAKVKEHEFANMIVLCANCHGRKGSKSGQISKRALRQYKANLAIMNSRYGELERRVLTYFAEHSDAAIIFLPANMHLLMMFLQKDGYFKREKELDYMTRTEGVFSSLVPISQAWQITPSGREFVKRWAEAQPLD